MVKTKKKCDDCGEKYNHLVRYRDKCLCRKCYRKNTHIIGTITSKQRLKENPDKIMTNLYVDRKTYKKFKDICKKYKMKRSTIINHYIHQIVENENRLEQIK